MRRSHPSSFDAAVARMAGGRVILEARRRARRLLERLPPPADPDSGAMGGYGGLRRHGSIADLLPSEHLQDDDEFLRRHVSGEQLYLSRHRSPAPRAAGEIAWDLTVASLGVVRRLGLGLALALCERHSTTGPPCRLVLDDRLALDLESIDELQEALAAPPAATSPHARSSGGALHRIVSGVRSPAQIEALRGRGPSAGGLFVVRSHAIELWHLDPRRRRDWRRESQIVWPRGWWRR